MTLIVIATNTLLYGTIKAAQRLHQHLLNGVFGAPQTFFDTVPIGRILSRFSSDLRTVDDTLPQNFEQLLSTVGWVGFKIFFHQFFRLKWYV